MERSYEYDMMCLLSNSSRNVEMCSYITFQIAAHLLYTIHSNNKTEEEYVNIVGGFQELYIINILVNLLAKIRYTISGRRHACGCRCQKYFITAFNIFYFESFNQTFYWTPLLCLRNIPVDMSYTLRGAQTCSFQDAGESAPHILNDFIVSYKREANMKTSPR